MYYANEIGGSLKALKIAKIDSDAARPLGNSNVQTGTSVYQALNLSSFTKNKTGTFPSADGTGSTAASNLIYAGNASRSYTTSNGVESIYEAYIKSSFDTASASASVFSLKTDSTQYFYLYSNDGDYLNMYFLINPTESSSGATIGVWQLSDAYTGYYYQNYSLGSHDDETGSFCFAISGNLFGVLMYSKGDLEHSRYTTISFLTLSYQQQEASPFYWISVNRESDPFVIPSSGSTDSESTGDGNSGYGDYDFSNDDVSPDDDISGSSPAIATGLVNPYYVTASEIAALGNFLWSDSFYDSIAKTFSNPMDCIISLASFPVASSAMSLGSSESVRVGNTTSSSTGTRLISEFVTIDCGSVSVPEVWGSYLDYAQTKLYIYIPYLGIEELPLCECMGGSVACKLRINLLTGALVACLTLTSGTYVTGSARVQPIYFSTTCKSDIPVSGATTGALAGAFQLLGGAVSTVAGIASGTAPVAVAGLASAAQGVATMQSQNSQISGAVGAAGGQMAHKTPFLIFDRPVQSVPANLASVAGYQSNSGTTLSRCSGYVICDTINLDGLALTRSELEEVEQICTSGVYIS